MNAPGKQPAENSPTWLQQNVFQNFRFSWETAIFALILVLAIATRFYDLETRVMSHDETSHVYYSWRLYKGMGYEHTPLTHGPWQFHAVALFYFIFGDNDFTARIPAVLTSIASVWILWHYRHWLGRAGTLLAAGMWVISPYMLYYARYVRNEAYVGLFGLIAMWAMLRYLEVGHKKYLYWLTIGTVLHFTAKETSFIYLAQMLFFLGLLFVHNVSQHTWKITHLKRTFLATLLGAFTLLGVGGFILLSDASATKAAGGAFETDSAMGMIILALGGLAFAAATAILAYGYTIPRIFKNRAASMILLLMTIVLPQLAPLLMLPLGWDAQDYSSTGLFHTSLFLFPLIIIGAAIGVWWNRREWFINAAIFYGIFIVFYTTIFTNGIGFFTGIVGSLAYWLAQQEVQRGSQPWYYYIGIQIPIYEFLPAIGSLLAGYLGIRKWIKRDAPADAAEVDEDQDQGFQPVPAILFFGYWIVTAILAYTYAGEKMPWLTYHIALPMILVAGWAFGKLVDSVDWGKFKERQGWVILGIALIFVPSITRVIASMAGPTPPFQGSTLDELRVTANFITSLVAAIGSGAGLYLLSRQWSFGQLTRLTGVVIIAFLGIITARASFRAAYINYDNAKEYLVYAHSGGGMKTILSQVEEISRRTTGELDIQIAYDNESTYPYWWYLRNFPNQRYYAENPTRDLREFPIILVGDNNFGKIEPVVARSFHQFDHIRMWWPDQDYYYLTWERLRNAFTDAEWRGALFDIWFNRDYTRYAGLSGKDMSISNWNPSDRMRMYIRKDLVTQLWNYGAAGVPTEISLTDPYEGKEARLQPSFFFGNTTMLSAPRGIAVGPDGTIYVADSRNHRIQQFDPEGFQLNSWGTFANILEGSAPPSTFNEPWDVAVGPDGAVYVADTWNHRIQKFTASGQFVTMWGYFGQAETGDAFWGPRSVVVSNDNRVFVSDTGNKRIAIFDSDGAFLGQVGSAGMLPGQFDEPVGIALDSENLLYVIDTWNQRLQVLAPLPTNPNNYISLKSWDIYAWYGQSLENKPYIDVSADGNIFITDPEGYRIIQFDPDGNIVSYWGDYSTGTDGFGIVSGISFDQDGGLWISDAGNNRVLQFIIP